LAVAAYEGARSATEKGATNDDVMSTAGTILNDRGVDGGSVVIDPGDVTAAAVGSYITVTTSADAAANAIFPGLSNITITVDAVMMKEY
jgi:hypothetical protein